MADIIRNIKGTKDLLPNESRLWLETESIIHNFMNLHGYHLIRTPVFEKTESVRDLNPAGFVDGNLSTTTVSPEMHSKLSPDRPE